MSDPCGTLALQVTERQGCLARKDCQMADKHTKRELFQTLLVLATASEADEWVVAGIQHELELLDKRSQSKGANPKRVAEQRRDMDAVSAVLSDEPMRATAIANEVGFSVQKVTALLRKMVAANEAIRHEDKKVTTFTSN